MVACFCGFRGIADGGSICALLGHCVVKRLVALYAV